MMNNSDCSKAEDRKGTVLVTGASGFIGRELVDSLGEQGKSVRAIGRRDLNLPSRPNVEYRRIDITDFASVRNLMDDIDVIFHLAGAGSPASTTPSVPNIYDVNLTGSFNVLQAASESGVRRVVVGSSAAIYGRIDSNSILESSPLVPVSAYGHSKASLESLCEMFSRERKLTTIALRLFNVYGPGELIGDESGKLIPNLIRRIRLSQPVSVFGDGNQTRDFIHVSDVVDAFIASAGIEFSGHSAINIGTGFGTTIIDVIRQIEICLGISVPIEHLKLRQNEIVHSVADVSKARSYGFESKIDIAGGIESLFVDPQ